MGRSNVRVLVIDDERDIGEDFLRVLGPRPSRPSSLRGMEQALFGATHDAAPAGPVFDVDVALCGKDGRDLVIAAEAAHRPYAVAFVDMRMPGGWDGLTTIEALWQSSPSLHVVICTAYCDFDWHQINVRLGMSEQLLILRKPFDPIEIQQLACSLSAKWRLLRENEQRLAELEQANAALKEAMEARLRLERDLRQMQKLDALGRVAANLGHEINNPLAYIRCNLDLLKDHLRTPAAHDGEDALTLVEEADAGIERIRLLVQELRAFSRKDDKGERDASAASVPAAIDGALRLAGRELAQRARIVRDVASDLPAISGSVQQLEQVVLNLLTNALHALPEHGDHEIRIRARCDRDDVVLEIEDTGAGIDPAHVERIFEPFFTTKAVGAGTGLGLSICREIIVGFGGSISVTSVLARGTTFRMTLPIYDGATPHATSSPPRPAASPGPDKGRVLLVDDEPQFLKSLQRVLRNFDVEIASGVDAAMALYRDHPFDVVVCDLNMPGRTGRDLHEELALLGPEHADRVIFMTGGAFHEWAHAFLSRISNPYIEKPMSARGVSDVIEGHLGVLRARERRAVAASR
jgi:two-component system, NtrC family, sensor kinase